MVAVLFLFKWKDTSNSIRRGAKERKRKKGKKSRLNYRVTLSPLLEKEKLSMFGQSRSHPAVRESRLIVERRISTAVFLMVLAPGLPSGQTLLYTKQ